MSDWHEGEIVNMPTDPEAAVLHFAIGEGTVYSWPWHLTDKDIRSCRSKDWLKTWETSGIQMAQTVYRPNPVERDAITEKGRKALRRWRILNVVN